MKFPAQVRRVNLKDFEAFLRRSGVIRLICTLYESRDTPLPLQQLLAQHGIAPSRYFRYKKALFDQGLIEEQGREGSKAIFLRLTPCGEIVAKNLLEIQKNLK